MLNAMLAKVIGASTGSAVLPARGDWYLPTKEVTGTLGSGNDLAVSPFIFCESNRHFIPITEQQASVMNRALTLTAEVIDEGYLVD